jgi:hypothetical protein
MRDTPCMPGRIGLRGVCVALLWPAMMVASTGFAGAHILPGIGDGAAALRERPGLIVPAAQLEFTARDVQFEPGAEVPLELRLPSAEQLKLRGGDAGAFILVRNLPDGFALSEGIRSGANWIMSLPQAERARLLARQGTAGNHRLDFLLIGPGNRVLAEMSFFARLTPPKPKTDASSTTASLAGVSPQTPVAALSGGTEPEKRQAAPAKPVKPTVSPEDEAILLAKGAELVGQGGIAGARLMFEELAQQGSSKGALALARTYDPAYIAAAPAGSIVPDIAKALAWYERAAALGSGEATQRLSQLVPQR